jgi:hypothetical protein
VKEITQLRAEFAAEQAARESEIITLRTQLSLIQSHWFFRLTKFFKRTCKEN